MKLQNVEAGLGSKLADTNQHVVVLQDEHFKIVRQIFNLWKYYLSFCMGMKFGLSHLRN